MRFYFFYGAGSLSMKVGFIGLGHMGSPMAENILKGGFPLFVYNRTQGKTKTLLAAGAAVMKSPEVLAEQVEVLVTMVSNDAALKEIVESLWKVERKGLLHISMSTVSPELCEELEKKHQERGQSFVAAPVSGRPERAKLGKLWIFLGGKEDAKAQAMPILKTMSEKVFDLGVEPYQAALFKLCNNFMILSLIDSFAQAASLLEKRGISFQKAAEVWGNSLFDAPIFHAYVPMFTKLNFSEAGFALNLGLKDMRLLQACRRLCLF